MLPRVRESAVAAWPGQNRAGDARWDQQAWGGGRLKAYPAPENAGALVPEGSKVVFHLKAKDNTPGTLFGKPREDPRWMKNQKNHPGVIQSELSTRRGRLFCFLAGGAAGHREAR